MGLGYLLVLSALLVTRATARCSQEDCETGISAGVAAASACSAVGGVLCAFTFGIGCIVAAGCGAAGGIAGAAKGACRACGQNANGAGIDVDRLMEHLSSNTDRLSDEMRTNTDRLSDEMRTNTDRLSDEIRANTDRLIVRINNLTLLVEEVIDQSIKIEGQIQLSQIIALYGEDITNYIKVRRAFKGLRKNSMGLIIRDIDASRFEHAANHAIYGLAASSMQIFQMMTGGHPLKAESIFQAVPDFCKNEAKDYFVKVMFDCFLLESISRAMTGDSMSPARVLSFKKQLILIEDQFIKDCGCPEGHVKTARISNLQSALVSLASSQPSGHCSSSVTYADRPVPTFIMDDSIDRLTLKKLNVLYSAAPFSPAKSAAAKAITETYSIEQLKLAEYLSTSHSSADLELYEGYLLCAKPECCNTMRVTGVTGSDGFFNGKYTRTSQLHNDRVVYKKGNWFIDLCLFYGKRWQITGCSGLKTDQLAPLVAAASIKSSADTVCPESVGLTWQGQEDCNIFGRDCAVDPNISVDCICS